MTKSLLYWLRAKKPFTSDPEQKLWKIQQ